MPRAKKTEASERIIFVISEANAAKLRLYTFNPMTGKSFCDDRSQSSLVNRLLSEFFSTIAKENSNV